MMNSPAEMFDTAYALHAAGKLGEALPLYRAVVAADPSHARAWHQLGCIASQYGQLSEAEPCFVRAIRLDGGQALYHNNLGDCYRALRGLSRPGPVFSRRFDSIRPIRCRT